MFIEPDLSWKLLAPESLERAYSPSSAALDFPEVLEVRRAMSLAAAEKLGPGEVVPYGPLPRESAILYEAPERAAPLLVFFHGGYWQEGAAGDVLFPAQDLLPKGISFASVGYALAPRAALADIVSRSADAVESIVRRYRRSHPGATVVLSGSSAGAHLVAMMMNEDWAARGFDGPPFSQAVLLSGIYDLAPLVGTRINEALKLDEVQAMALSPLYLPLRDAVPCIVCRGRHETAAFARQGERFAARLRREGIECRTLEVPGRDHFTLVFDLADETASLGREVLARLGEKK